MPSWLMWLAPVPLATLAAVAWTAWTGRSRGPGEASASVADHARFRAALSAPPAPATLAPPSAALPLTGAVVPLPAEPSS